MADTDPADNFPKGYVPSDVWTWDRDGGGRFASINRPVSGAIHDAELKIGDHPIQLYSLGTPNGQKVTIMLEELLAAGHADAEYDAWLVKILEGDQFSSGFVDINPNSKIPAMADHSFDPPVRLFESGSILLHLAERFGAFIPQEMRWRAETINWLMWQMGSAPLLGGGFGHFYAYAPMKIKYAIDRYAMEAKRQLHVLDTQLSRHEYIAGEEYSIADIAIWPWYGGAIMSGAYDAATFLSVEDYPNLRRWTDQIGQREAVKRGRIVNKPDAKDGIAERHSAKDIDAFLESNAS